MISAPAWYQTPRAQRRPGHHHEARVTVSNGSTPVNCRSVFGRTHRTTRHLELPAYSQATLRIYTYPNPKLDSVFHITGAPPSLCDIAGWTLSEIDGVSVGTNGKSLVQARIKAPPKPVTLTFRPSDTSTPGSLLGAGSDMFFDFQDLTSTLS